MHCGNPVKNFHGTWDCYNKCQKGENILCRSAHSGSEHVMSPYKISDKCYGNAGGNNEVITEDCFMTERRDNFRNCSHGRKDHNIYSRMAICPEQMLIQKRISTQRRIKKTYV